MIHAYEAVTILCQCGHSSVYFIERMCPIGCCSPATCSFMHSILRGVIEVQYTKITTFQLQCRVLFSVPLKAEINTYVFITYSRGHYVLMKIWDYSLKPVAVDTRCLVDTSKEPVFHSYQWRTKLSLLIVDRLKITGLFEITFELPRNQLLRTLRCCYLSEHINYEDRLILINIAH